MMTRAEIIAEARRWLQVPYRPRGRSVRGIDCLGLLVMVGRAFSVPHTDQQDYSMWPREDHLILHKLAEFLRPVKVGDPLPGCIGAFAERRLPGHVGIFSEVDGRLHLIHARIIPPVVVEQHWVPNSEMRLIGRYALPGMTD